MLNISQTGIGDNINLRERDVIVLKGIKAMQMMRNTANAPMIIHCALITWKNQANVLSTTEFFRSFDGTRAVDFDPTTQSSMTFCNYPLNTDRMYVHYHKKYWLAPETDAQGQMGTEKNIRFHKKYTKFYRQIRYDELDVPNNSNLYFVWWADRVQADIGQAPQLGFSTNTETVSYFRDPKV